MTMMILIAVLDAFLQPWGDTAREIKLMNSFKTFGEWCENGGDLTFQCCCFFICNKHFSLTYSSAALSKGSSYSVL